ncbi:MAG: hypothetical protein QJQ54_02830 [Mollicutes bacterium]|nr:MAG: hypothetical protein QJQ54_02830 [Mollicutes bacterium]
MKKLSLFLLATPLRLILAVFVQNKLLISQSQDLKQNLVEHFFPLLVQLLKKINLSFAEIEEVFAGNGPGSYTSERVVAVFLRTLKVMRPTIKIFTISNLFLLSGKQPKTISLIEANKKEYFFAGFDYEKLCIAPNKILKKDLSFLQKKYPNFRFVTEQNKFKIASHFENLRIFFRLKTDYRKILPIKEIR